MKTWVPSEVLSYLRQNTVIHFSSASKNVSGYFEDKEGGRVDPTLLSWLEKLGLLRQMNNGDYVLTRDGERGVYDRWLR